MIIALDDSVFQLPDDASRRRLLSLIQGVVDRGHYVHHMSGDPVPSGSFAERALGASSPLLYEADRVWIAECLRNGFQAAQHPNASRRIVHVVDGRTDWTGRTPVLSLADAMVYITRPIEVLVENSENDRRFLQCWAPAARANDFASVLQQETMEFKNGGGLTGVTNTLKGAKERGERSVLHRTLVVFDSDAAEPGQIKKEVSDCEAACADCLPSAASSPRFHRLKRRAIENYLPYTVLDHYVAGPGANHVHDDAVSHLRALGPTSVHARHYHMKNGLLADMASPQRKRMYRAQPNVPFGASGRGASAGALAPVRALEVGGALPRL